MPKAIGVRVPRGEAEATRRRLLELGVLRIDLEVAKSGDDVVFPVADSCGPTLPTVQHEFAAREVRPAGYQELLPWPAALKDTAPRAFDQLGDIAVVKVPPDLWPRRAELGQALLGFAKCRAVFADHGVKDDFRVRRLERIAGQGPALTQVVENGVRLWVDLGQAYFSPRLATERARVAGLVKPAEHVIDLFAGVGPLAIQAALRGARVDAVDLNPAAIVLAHRNVEENKVAARVALHQADARHVRLQPADRIVMNLPHGARDFLDVALRMANPRATIHLHEILATTHVAQREQELAASLEPLGRRARNVSSRTVRHYSPTEEHVVFDIELE